MLELRMAWRTLILVLGAAAVVLPGCATPMLNPAQERAYGAFKDCQQVAATAQLGELREDGGISFTARPGDYQRMLACLSERHGYK
ncbi:MAG TPA: hypothetical protein VFG27_13680 [Pseudomonadales bacterium]|nr:hypothetical protein [Pseudomonadales bacterium]